MLRIRLKRARKVKGWTQRTLAELSGISQPLIAKYELGHKPSARNLNRLCIALGVDIEYLNGSLESTAFIKIDDEEFKKILKKSVILPPHDKVLVKELLIRLIYLQELEDRRIKKYKSENLYSVSESL